MIPAMSWCRLKKSETSAFTRRSSFSKAGATLVIFVIPWRASRVEFDRLSIISTSKPEF